MNIPQEPQAGPAENNRPEPAAPAAAPRHADWISYAVALAKQAQPASQATR